MTPAAVLPCHWQSGNIRRFAEMKSGHTPSRSVPEYWDATDIPWFTLADVWQLRDGKQIYLGDTANKINELGLANSAAELLPIGTVVLSRTASVGFSGIMPTAMATSQDYWNWVCGPELLPEYLNYQFKSMSAEFKSLNMGSTHQTIYQKDAAGLHIVVPPLDEQRSIANYLDRETARIDALIEEQQGLIELLRERRDGVVTKVFLDSTNDERPLKLAVDDVTVGIVVQPSRWYAESGVPALRGVNVKRGSISFEDLVRISEEGHAAHRKSQLRAGDVVVVRTGHAGAAAKIPDELDGANAIDILIVRPGKRTDPDFLVWYLNSPLAASRIEHGSVGALQGHFNVSALRGLPFPDECPSEQRRIASYLDEQIAKIDRTITETERFVELARERRSALITAVVTGQINVQEMA